MCKICVFAGTLEGRRLVTLLMGRGARITACVATEYGRALLTPGEDVRVLTGRMDEAEIARMLRREQFDVVVDATHPYADKAGDNIRAACQSAGVGCLRLARERTGARADVVVRDAAACAEYLKTTRGNILLTTGAKELPAFCADAALRERLYARVLPMPESLKQCEICALAPSRVLAMQGPFSEEMNLAMLHAVDAAVLVTKDTGEAGGFEAKMAAAQKAGVHTVVIARPPRAEDGLSLLETVKALEGRFPLKPAPKRVTLIGAGMGGLSTRTRAMEEAVRQADCLIGAKRMLEGVDGAGKERFMSTAPDQIARFIEESPLLRRFAVLLSGDVGFYSGARRLIESLRGVEMEIIPGVSSLQYFCARLGRPWEDVRCVSLHGRACDLAREAREHRAVFALVGGEDGVRRALKQLVDGQLGELQVHVGERLGYPDERVLSGTARQLCARQFDPLSVILIENEHCRERVVTHGLPDESFERGQTPMTKAEVRAVSLSKLRLTRGAVVYDVGSGSGSVSVEAALLAGGGQVYAIEKNPEAAQLTRRNADRFGLTNVETLCAAAPEAFDGLPAPTHAFIGGSSGNIAVIIERLLQKNPRVRIVANAVTLETLAQLNEISKGFSYCDVAQLSVAKPKTAGGYRLMSALNPVFIFTMQNGGEDA